MLNFLDLIFILFFIAGFFLLLGTITATALKTKNK